MMSLAWRGNENALHGVGVLAWQPGLRHRRHIGQGRRALGTGDGQRAQHALLHLGRCRRQGREGDRDVAADGGLNCRARPSELHGHQVEPLRDAEKLARKMRGCADAGRGEAVLARVGLDELDQLLHAFGRNGGMHGQYAGRGAGNGDGAVLVGIVGIWRRGRATTKLLDTKRMV